jgi:NosR/NirI family transcriptional regulator, nitrous oxide reductase regulator
MRCSSRTRQLSCLLLGIATLGATWAPPHNDVLCGGDQSSLNCAHVLPDAVRFEQLANTTFHIGYNAAGTAIGWVTISTAVVDILAYSGKPLITLIGINKKRKITGVEIVHHSEPILLVGIPEAALKAFERWYVGRELSATVFVGQTDKAGTQSIDAISGATVTSLALNQTILGTARKLALGVNLIEQTSATTGHFVEQSEPLTWAQMEEQGLFGRLFVSEKQMGEQQTEHGQFVNLWFTIADAPQVGRALFGDNDYAWLRERQKPGEHLVVILGSGSQSFKGSGFVRGGIFDRVRIEQGLRQIVFRDTDYRNLSSIQAAGAPSFDEGALFFTRKNQLRAGDPFNLIFMGSRYDQKGGFSRSFRSFSSTFELPDSLYQRTHTIDPLQDEPIYHQAWRLGGMRALLLSLFLLGVMALFVGRAWLTQNIKRLSRIHTTALVISVVFIGFILKAQPSITQLLTLIDGAFQGFQWSVYLSEPTLFVFWISIAIVTLIWGRGVFCGWTCPFGALTELQFLVGRRLRLPAFELPDAIHQRVRYLKYVALVVIVATYLMSPILGEMLTEIEPFKTTFLVRPWSRDLAFTLWWGLILGASLVWFRPFCRYLCPLGAGLALASSRAPLGPYRRQLCRSCTICRRDCQTKAFRDDGSITKQECLSCMECEVNYADKQVCPPLVALEALKQRSQRDNKPIDPKKLQRVENMKRDWK